MKIKEQREQIASTMREWEELEKESSSLIEKIKDNCGNPLICLVMDIIQNDAKMHARVQELIINSLEQQPLNLSPDEVGEAIALIRKHTELKSHMVEMAGNILGNITDKSLRVQTFLLETLYADEKKHKEMLEGIEGVRSGLYPYWPH